MDRGAQGLLNLVTPTVCQLCSLADVTRSRFESTNAVNMPHSRDEMQTNAVYFPRRPSGEQLYPNVRCQSNP